MHVRLFSTASILSSHNTNKNKPEDRNQAINQTDTTHCISNQTDTTHCITNGPRSFESPPNRVDTGLEIRDRRHKGTTNCTPNGLRPFESSPNRGDTGLEVRDRRAETHLGQPPRRVATGLREGAPRDLDGPRPLGPPPRRVARGPGWLVTVTEQGVGDPRPLRVVLIYPEGE
ncbi:hypothetical protein QAD02_018044 [Eretmocerus hayati]|uniref:Uncharacterized protein n=1 Tax=Eretmocerus hayati TaxID=131215 RepID=A0ACC2PFY8_9HYME|nr:hypothetical protein QAD02_018044 [Eretmocerus hayati]